MSDTYSADATAARSTASTTERSAAGTTERSAPPTTARSTAATTYGLPGDDVYPEGIVASEEIGAFFVSGARSGDIFRGDLATGEISVLVPGDGRDPLTTVGLDLDRSRRLWVAGGASGKVFTFDASTGELLHTLETPPSHDTFINDLVVCPSGDLYATDSLRPWLFRVRSGSLAVDPWLELSGTPFESVEEGSDTNGIVVTPDEEYLIVVKTGTGQLFRVGTRTGEIREIDTGGEDLTGGDGLVLEGRSLYLVRNAAREVVLLELSADMLTAEVVSRFTDPSFEFPTTAAKIGGELLVVNSQFDVMGDGRPRLPFRVSRVRLG